MDIVLLSCNTGNDSEGDCIAMELAEAFPESRILGPNKELRLANSGYYWVDYGGKFNEW